MGIANGAMPIKAGGGGGGPGGGGGRAARALRLLLLLVMALAALECASVFEASPLRSYLHAPAPLYNATLPSLKSREKTQRSQKVEMLPNVLEANEKSISTERKKEESKNKTVVYNGTVTTRRPFTTTKKIQMTTKLNSLAATATVRRQAVASSTENINDTDSALPYCELPNDLGTIAVNKSPIKIEAVELKFPEVSQGGWYKPPNCTAKHRVAIIIPYRDRPVQLAIFLNHMHPFLMRQQLEYGIFVIEQADSKPNPGKFNRAKLFNVGFVEANRLRKGGWQCFVFHDVDLLPLDEQNLYTCPRQPRHMSTAIDKFNYQLSYLELFGGVSAMTYEQFKTVNGFSNKYWGWGGEDDDMSYRIRKMKYHVARYKMSIARYTMLTHERQVANPKRYQLLSQTGKNFKQDGLTSLTYKLKKIQMRHLFTLVSVDIDFACACRE